MQDWEHPIGFVEVDGPHHYRNGRLRRKDKMKEMLYRRRHPLATFTRVSYDQVKRLGTGKVVFAVANFITLTSSHTMEEKARLRDDELHAWSARNAERELKKLLELPAGKRNEGGATGNNGRRRRQRGKQSQIRNHINYLDQNIYSIFGDVTWSEGEITCHLKDEF